MVTATLWMFHEGRLSKRTMMRLPLLSFLLCLFTSINALHFYLDANQKRCFVEELPSDTVVEGTSPNLLIPGHNLDKHQAQWN